jgi:hypothetical protein
LEIVNITDKKEGLERFSATIRTTSGNFLDTTFTGYLFDIVDTVPSIIGFIDETLSKRPHLMINMDNLEYIDMALIEDE